MKHINTDQTSFMSKRRVLLSATFLVLFLGVYSVQIGHGFTLGIRNTVLPHDYEAFLVKIPNGSYQVTLEANNTLHLRLVNQTNYARYIDGDTYEVAQEWLEVANETWILDHEQIRLDLGYPAYVEDSTEGWASEPEVPAYFILENIHDDAVSYIFEFEEEKSLFIDHMRFTMRFLLIGVCFYLAYSMYQKSEEILNENPEENDHLVVRYFSFSFFVTSCNYLLSEIDLWLEKELGIILFPSDRLQSTVFPFLSFRIDQLAFILIIAVSQIIMFQAIESHVLGRKYPIYGILLTISNGILFLSIFVPVLFEVGIISAVLIQIWTYSHICYLYIQAGLNMEGVIRQKSFAVAAGLLIPVLMLILGNELIPDSGGLSMTLADIITIVAFFLLRYGII